MDKDIIKAWLLEKKPGIYSVIVETYKEQALTLKPSFFLDWIAKELDVKADQISPTGVYAAIKRRRKPTKEKAKGNEKKKGKTGDFSTDIPESFDFK